MVLHARIALPMNPPHFGTCWWVLLVDTFLRKYASPFFYLSSKSYRCCYLHLRGQVVKPLITDFGILPALYDVLKTVVVPLRRPAPGGTGPVPTSGVITSRSFVN